eukprot:CAMPEP_0197719500 /NCGR_PEP_ID=MMETSP1434-20131217/3225_1 /TAXON_ID=265543 /ORGANISM="Minutocellus polymorphus, Strain CCMP3303" /LENGTH=389 /DNA_ID=CAMNT_0043304253 /DNA_START=210 /DNA_END=1379 /DNA_ORIENTATION=+
MRVTYYKISESEEETPSVREGHGAGYFDRKPSKQARLEALQPIDIATIQQESASTHSVVPRKFDNFKSSLLKKARGGVEHSDYAANLLMYVAGGAYSDLLAFEDMLRRAFIRGVNCMQIETKNDPMFICATAQVIRSSDGEVAIVSFRGTELTNIVNWLTDATTSTIEAFPKGIKVHAGFLRNFEAIWPEILKALMWQSDKDKEEGNCGKGGELKALYIAGHSLGGAMTMLAAMSMYFAKEGERSTTGTHAYLWSKLRGVYTYGQPMVLDPSYDVDAPIDEISPYIFRHVYQKDIVPHLPPKSTGDFVHIGSEFFGEKIDEEKLEYSSWEKKGENSEQAASILIAGPIAALAFFLGLIPHASWFAERCKWSFADHSPWGYLYVGGKIGQ